MLLRDEWMGELWDGSDYYYYVDIGYTGVDVRP